MHSTEGVQGHGVSSNESPFTSGNLSNSVSINVNKNMLTFTGDPYSTGIDVLC